MDIMSFGIDYSTGRLIQKPIEEQDLADMILGSFPHETLSRETMVTAIARTFKARGPALGPNKYDPLAVGWSFLVSDKDPQKQEIIDAMQPLAIHRKMNDPTHPLIYDCRFEHEWMDWMRDNCWAIAVPDKPFYVLIVGGPNEVPFRFQTTLDSSVGVGRVSFDSIEELKAYIQKVIRLENSESAVSKKACIFATDYGSQDPTFYSHRFMAEPLSIYTNGTLNCETTCLFESDATKANLVNAFTRSNPALIYVASHGMAAQNEDLEVQKKVNGAICCKELGDDPAVPREQGIFSADDVPTNKACAEGSAIFDFSCFGYGTPARSDFYHWTTPKNMRKPGEELNTTADFIAALPKKLLAHPRGPVGFFGHVDTAWLCAFADPNNPYIMQRWTNRMGPFKKAVEEILKGRTLGMALDSMNANYNLGNNLINNFNDRVRAGLEQLTPEKKSTLVDYWITRNDAANYMLFGDPATYINIAV